MITTITQNDLDLHAKWIARDPGGVRLVTTTGKIKIDANLSGADLRHADLSGANISGADLDYSCWPLWCGSKHVKVDVRLAAQLAGHGAVVDVNLTDATTEEIKLVTDWQASCRALGKIGHHARELGLL